MGLKPKGGENAGMMSKEFINMRNKELQNGRLAMLAVAGMIAQEEVDGRSILSHLYEFGLKRGP